MGMQNPEGAGEGGRRFAELAEACREAGCTRRQTAVMLGAASGESDLGLANALGIKVEAVAQTLRAGIRKLEQRFPARRGLSRSEARDLLRCFENKQSRRHAPKTPVFDSDGRRVGARASPFGTTVEDLASDPRGSTQVVLELVSRMAGVEVPRLTLRCEEAGSRCGAQPPEWVELRSGDE
jgi:hypothetical protein